MATANVIADLESARDNLAAKLAEVTANPKPSYSIDGQSISWPEYYRMLAEQIEAVTVLLGKLQPYSVRSQVM